MPLNTLCLRYRPAGGTAPGSGAEPGGVPATEEELNALNAEIMARANATGRAYFTHTKLDGRYVIRRRTLTKL